jgi:NADH-quinone oxidoreductase subunit N
MMETAQVTIGHFLVIGSPEIVMAIGAMALLMLGVMLGERALSVVSTAAIVLLILVAGIVAVIGGERLLAFHNGFVVDAFSDYVKIIVLVASAISIAMSVAYLKAEKLGRAEYPVLVVLATLGMMMMVSANDLISLYVGIELQSLPLYVLAAFHRDNARSTEAGLKYFVLGALSSGLLLYGASLVYGFSGTTNFNDIFDVLRGAEPAIGVIIGLVFLASGLAFKVSAVPFHMWTPDVYEGSPTPITAFFAAAPKLAAMALFIRVLMGPFGDMVKEWQQVIVLIAAASMIWGAFAAIGQTNIKRLMAYSSIGHVGYALMGLAAGTELGVRNVLIYMTIYLVMTLGAFVCILAMRRPGGMVEDIADLSGLSRTRPLMALALGVLLLSLAGIPPLAGFIAKFYVFQAALQAGLVWLAVIGGITTVIGTYYYLRIVKLMYLDAPKEPFLDTLGLGMKLMLAASVVFTAGFILFPGPLLKAAALAASAF